MNIIRIFSAARPASEHNSSSPGGVKYNMGKPKTIIEGECDSIRERLPMEPVHYREEGKGPCLYCGKWSGIWTDSRDRWDGHSMKCRRA